MMITIGWCSPPLCNSRATFLCTLMHRPRPDVACTTVLVSRVMAVAMSLLGAIPEVLNQQGWCRLGKRGARKLRRSSAGSLALLNYGAGPEDGSGPEEGSGQYKSNY